MSSRPAFRTRPFAASLLVVAVGLSLGHAVRLLALSGPEAALAVAAGLVCGALVADAVTGLVHWACDTWGSDETRWLGPALIRGFRAHHREPLGMLEHDWVTVNAEPGVAACAGLALLALPVAQPVREGSPFLYAALLGLLVLGGVANQLHCWAHAPDPPRGVRALQRHGVLLSRRRHARHHGAGHTAAYCISTGWLNPLLDGLGAWRALERLVEGATGVPPRRGQASSDLGPRSAASGAAGPHGLRDERL